MSTFKNRMYNHEVVPPANAWEKIASALDESMLQNEFPSKLYNTEINPPATAWDKITASLEKEQFQNEFSSRLYNMEIAPPAASWDKVASSLNKTAETEAAPIRKLSPRLRYAAAAILIGAVAYGVTRLNLHTANKEKATVVATVNKDTSKPGISNPADQEIVQTPDITPRKEDDEALEKSKTLIARLDKPGKKARRVTASSLITQNNDDVMAEAVLSESVYAYTDHIPAMADRYVMLMTPDGNIIRMSKKWSELLCCVSGEEQDADCKDQLKKWQEKIAGSALAPSPGNFMDILGLVNSLNDSKKL